ncbi:MAG: Ribose-phosphate pyrophosphokinase [Candidatus Gottesmanbacteria bacterium GW2011_GWA2_44_17]|uniref:ribose-phosphate diphosphokinase n=3 Tax=Candidatus Gottesmaniibacteriota TaxID=1752720 RepID=A0A0G1KWK7_9BACT|nr:MAG: Ribose-phosphate pyrophosphokinase [Candidatus Gottesmanbacteria bacterium GW2011_GWB1_44_11c]KKT46524.1 MAG: Ribose-phosphate pyrophosphokinase [Candidatus Gottesmanbacteria bacterium GW2011_GWA2_44_17]KKT60682.1 MAG: Ribose-phosphate pyrophosphokinase [Candidatus Gottesmanbacteria bacterium GW2011_GWA1_44_24b]HCM82660.1 ribose-phosphate pyrophosphokinase [Patescibacteria group bacterium]
MKHFLLFSGSSNTPLAKSVSKILGIPLGNVDLTRFADGEIRPWIQEDVRDKTVFVLQSLSYDMDDHIMELCLMGDAIRRSAPKNMIAVIPYMGYARQDRQHRVGEPVSARVIAKFLEVSKFKEVITIDLHNDAIVGFFQVPVTHLSALSILGEEIQKFHLSDIVVVAPDVGGVKRARNLAYILDVPMVVMEKKRFLDRHDKSEACQIIGDVAGKSVVIIDDVISSGGTIINGAQSLKNSGATSVTVLVTHAVCAGNAFENVSKAPIDRMVITDTINWSGKKLPSFVSVVSVAPQIADAINTIIR